MEGEVDWKRTPVPTDIGFADGRIVGYASTGDEFTVRVEAWNAERLDVRFREPLALRDRGAGSISELCEVHTVTALLQDALTYHYDVATEAGDLRVFQFLDLGGEPALEVVATGCSVSHEPARPGMGERA